MEALCIGEKKEKMDASALMLKEEIKDPVWVLNKYLYKVHDIDINKYIKQGKIPLGTKPKPYWEYDGKIPEEDIKFFNMPKIHEPQPIFIFGIAGCQKTSLMKRFAHYFKAHNYNIFIFEPKDDEWIKGRLKPSKIGLAPNELPSSLNLIGLAPSYIFNKYPESKIKNYINVSLDLQEFVANDLSDFWIAAGLTIPATDYIRKNIANGVTISSMINDIEAGTYDVIHHSTRTTVLQKLSTFKFDGIFEKSMTQKIANIENKIEFEKLTGDLIKKYWKKNISIVLSAFYPEKKYLPSYFYYIMKKLFDLTIEYSLKNKKKVLKKAIFIDDSDIFIPDMGKKRSPASEIALHSLTLWRKFGFQVVLATQHPDMVDPMIIANCKHYFIYNIGKVERIEPYLNNPEIIKVIRKLKYNPNKYLVECCHTFQAHTKYETFFPFLSPIGHFIKTEEEDDEDETF